MCSAPKLPVTAGLAARYSAVPSWTVNRDGASNASELAGPQRQRTTPHRKRAEPGVVPSLINGHAALDFAGGARLATAPFPLTTDVTVFAVIQHRTPAQWGAIAHHGNRDDDWSMEQNGGGNSDMLHLQTNNDNTNVDVMLVDERELRHDRSVRRPRRYFSATAFGGTSPAPPRSRTSPSRSRPAASRSSSAARPTAANEASNAFIGELVYFNRALSDAERDAVIAYLSGCGERGEPEHGEHMTRWGDFDVSDDQARLRRVRDDPVVRRRGRRRGAAARHRLTCRPTTRTGVATTPIPLATTPIPLARPVRQGGLMRDEGEIARGGMGSIRQALRSRAAPSHRDEGARAICRRSERARSGSSTRRGSPVRSITPTSSRSTTSVIDDQRTSRATR